jgi:hypothetical protein
MKTMFMLSKEPSLWLEITLLKVAMVLFIWEMVLMVL